MFYDSESSEPTLDPEYDKFMQRGKQNLNQQVVMTLCEIRQFRTD